MRRGKSSSIVFRPEVYDVLPHVAAVVTWLQRRGVATTLRKAIEAAKGLINEYDEAPYTAEDVAKIEAAREP